VKGYVQRNPFTRKATWWKRYNGKAAIGKIVVYTITNTLGYIIDEVFQTFKPVTLISGVLRASDTVEYVNIGTTKALKHNGKLYMYDIEEQTLAEQDFVEEETEIIQTETATIIRFEKNIYVRQRKFDCQKETDQENNSHQPISGLLVGSSYLTIKTQNFSQSADEPKSGDLIFLHNQFWGVDNTSKTFLYTPKEQSVLHIALKAINK